MIDTKALRSRILDLAIQGKLTEQLDSDGIAEELYQQIQAEKQRLIKEEKITFKPIESISNDSLFEIPKSWKYVRFGDVAYIVRGGSPRPIKAYITDSADGINWIKIGDVEKGGKYIYSTNEKIKPEGEKKSRRVYPGDFLLTNSMSFGRPYISKIEGCIHDGWLLIRNLNGFDVDFLYHILSSAYLSSQFKDKASGSTVENLNIDKVNSAIIPLPPVAEQKRIVERVEEIFRVLDTIDEAQEKYSADVESLRSKLIIAGIQGRLTQQLDTDGTAEELYHQIQVEKQKLIEEGKLKKEKPLTPISPEEIPFEIPGNWKWVRFGDIMWNRDSERIPVSVADRKKLKKIYDYYGASGVIDKVEEYLFDKRLLLIGEDGANLLSRSTPIAFMADGKYWVNNHAHVLDCYVENYLDFVMYYINAISLVPYVTGSAQPKLNQDRMNKIPVPLPPLAEQKRIADVLEKALGEIG